MTANIRSGGQILIDQLLIHGVNTVFCVPGESYLAALDAFYDHPEIQLFTCRHEANAANMAEAYGKLTGKPGVCFVTRGPGACHASIGLHTALQDSTPLILFVGQVAREMSEREAFQEIEFRRFFTEVTKWCTEISDPERLPELVSQSFHRATSGRPGPVAISLPEDMLREKVAVEDGRKYLPVQASPSTKQIVELRNLLSNSRKPILILGGGTWTPDAVKNITIFAEKNNLPVSTAFRNQDRISNHHDNYVGDLGIGANPALLSRLQESDLIIACGTRIGEQTSQGYTLLNIPGPHKTLIHIHPDIKELGRVYRSDLPINSGMEQFTELAASMKPVDSSDRTDWTKSARNDYTENIKIIKSVGDLDMADVVSTLRSRLPKDAIIANDAGNFAGWVHRYLQFSIYPSQIGPASGAMGYCVSAALAAAIIHPERTVVGFAGDGGFLMSANELATAAQYGLKPIFLVVNNGLYGTIRMHQERDFPGRRVATDLMNPDFAMLANSFGLYGECITHSKDFPEAFDRAFESGKCAVLELRTDPESITPRTTLREIRETALLSTSK